MHNSKTVLTSFSVQSILVFLFALAIILLPFNDLSYFREYLKEVGAEGAFYPILFAVFVFAISLIAGNKIFFPRNISYYFVILFMAAVLISGIFNYYSIIYNYTKGRSGTEKYIFQCLLLFFCFLATLLFYNVFKNTPNPLSRIRKYALISFVICGLYSIVEVLFLFGSAWAGEVLVMINPWIHDTQGMTGDDLLYFGRLRSVSGEASWFAMYCAFIFPWIFSYLFTRDINRVVAYILFGYLLMLIIMTFSRVSYIITVIQIIIIIVGGARLKKDRYYVFKLVTYSIFLLFTGIISGYFLYDYLDSGHVMIKVVASLSDLENYSNVARYGSQVAAFFIMLASPIFGMGFGQYGFYMSEYIPNWAASNYQMQEWASATPGTPWAPVHGLYARLAAETGAVGLIIWLFIWITLIINCVIVYRKRVRRDGKDPLGLALLACLFGIIVGGLNLDSIRFFGYWIILGAGWIYSTERT